MVDNAEFDQFADEYDQQHRANIAVTGEGPEYFAEYKIREFRAMIGETPRELLDFGSGTGNSFPYFKQYFPAAHVTGVDVSQRSLDIAAERFPDTTGVLMKDNRIPLADNSADAAFSACVFHHIPHEEHLHWLGEIRRVTRAGGNLAIFEHNPLNPLTVHAVNTCPFDINAKLIKARNFAALFRQAGWKNVKIRYHVFFPRQLAALRPMEGSLAWLPLGGQYSVCAQK